MCVVRSGEFWRWSKVEAKGMESYGLVRIVLRFGVMGIVSALGAAELVL